jgi:lipoprotein-anchoring transpeptidase ErfK/SrfK
VRAAVTVPPTAVLIQRDAFRLTVAHDGRIRTFGVAVGQPAYPTPRGDFSIVNMQRNPTWYPPDSRWAAGLGPVPPGAGNPLGTRWMGISAPGIGMHGTPSPGSIGTRASHGCIRLRIPDAEALYELVSVGDPVYIR